MPRARYSITIADPIASTRFSVSPDDDDNEIPVAVEMRAR